MGGPEERGGVGGGERTARAGLGFGPPPLTVMVMYGEPPKPVGSSNSQRISEKWVVQGQDVGKIGSAKRSNAF
jgi:hypothetical protein